MNALIITLIQNAALLLAIMLVFDLATARSLHHARVSRQALAGAVLGVLCIGLMLINCLRVVCT